MAWYDGALQPNAPAGDLPFPGSPAWFAWQQQQFQNGYAPGYGATALPVYAPAAQATAPPVPLAPTVNPYVPPPAPAPPPLAYGGFGATTSVAPGAGGMVPWQPPSGQPGGFDPSTLDRNRAPATPEEEAAAKARFDAFEQARNTPIATMPGTLTTNPDGTIDYKQGDRTFHMDPNKFDPTGMYGNASDPPQERRGTFPTKPPGTASDPGQVAPPGGVSTPGWQVPETFQPPAPPDGTVGSPGFVSPPGGGVSMPGWQVPETFRPPAAPARPWYAFAGDGNQRDWGQTGLTNLSQDQQLFYDVNPSLVNRAVETYANADPLSHFRQYTQAQMPGIEQDFARWAVGPNAGAHYSDYVQQRYNDTARGFAGLSASQRGENPLAFGGGAGTAPGRMVFR